MGDISRADAIGQVQHAGAVGRQTDRRRAGNAAEPVGHQRGPLLVAHPDKLHRGIVVQGVENVQKGGPHNAEYMGNALLPQQFNDGGPGFLAWRH